RQRVDARRALVPPYPLPRLVEDVTPPHVVVQGMKTSTRMPLGRGPETKLQLSHFVVEKELAGVVSHTAFPRAYLLLRHSHRRGPSLPRRYSSSRSAVL